MSVGSSGRRPQVALSACYVEWDATEPEFCCENCDGKGIKKMCPYWMKKKQVEITTVEDFIDDGEKEILITTKPAESKSEYFKAIDIPDIKIKTPDKGTAECSSTTDPNYKQFDGGRFTVNTAGTFSLWKAPQRDWEVQGRVDSRGMNCGLAMRDGCDRIVFDRCAGGTTALSMRKYFDPKGDVSLQPKITRDGDKTWIVTSKRSGAQVKVIHRIIITRTGTTHCGWSGCFTSWRSSRREHLDFYLKTPGSDFGWYDSATAQKSVPRITGVCGIWSKDRSDDLKSISSGQTLGAVQYAAQFQISGSSLFDANPGVCSTTTPPVKIEPKTCSVVPRKIQKPVIGIFDIEDITELLKNSLEGEAEDEEDEGSKYTFNLNSIKEPSRSDEFEVEAERFCKAVILDTDVARRCQKMKVSGETIDLDQFVRSCYQDIWWQDSPNRQDSSRHILAAATFDSMEMYCIEMRAKSDEFSRGCPAGTGEDCQMTGDICVGDCTIKPINDFKEMLAVRCPNSCGKNFRKDGAGGKCMQNTKGKNVCICHSPQHWGGEDCTTEIGGVRPYISKLVPHTCDVSKGSACADEVVVHANTGEGTLFARSDGVRCRVDGKIVNATFLDQTRIRCHLPEYSHAIGKPVRHRKVSVALDGKTFAQPLHFCHHDSTCTECVSAKGIVNVKKDTCHIHDTCHAKGSKGDSQFNKCRVCDPAHSQTAWKYHYNHDDCAPKLKKNIAYEVNEMHPLQRAINLNNPVTTDMNYNTRDDKENKPTFTLMEDSQFFSLEKDTGIIRLIDSLDFEKAATHKLKVRASQGGLHSEGEVTISVFNADEGCSFAQSEYTATVVENAPLGALQGVNVSVSCPGGSTTNTYSLEVRGSGSGKAPFSINPTTGAVSTTKPLDFEERTKWPLVLLAKSAAGSVARAYLTVAVTGVNEAPTFINLDTASLKENQPKGAKVANIEVTDPDAGDTHTLGLAEDTEGWFEVKDDKDNKPALYLRKDGLDFETMSSKTIEFSLVAMDSKGAKFTMPQSIRVEDTNDAPTTIHVHAHEEKQGAMAPKVLASIPETAKVGAILGQLTVDDQDADQAHGFTILGDSPFAVEGSSLVLAKALDFETNARVSVVLVAYDTSESNPLTSKKQTFEFEVVDGADVPRDFKVVADSIIPEMSPAGTVVGTVEAVDQDMDDDFIIKILDTRSAFAVGKTSCSQVLGRGTVCTAQLEVSGEQAIDFEANRVTLHEAQLTVRVGAKSVDGKSDCGDACPVVKISDAPDQPSGATLSAAGISDVTVEQDGSVTIQESADMLGALAAVDDDDLCPLSIEGCADITSPGAYSFTIAPHDQFELTGACADAKPTDARVAGSSCSLRVKGGATLAVGAKHEVVITVTDQGGLSADHVQKITVTEAKVAIVLETTSDMLMAQNAAGEFEFAEEIIPDQERWQPASRVKVNGWTSEEAVAKPTVVSGPFRLGTYTRRSRRGATTTWTLQVDTTKLNVAVNRAVTLVIALPATDTFEGLEQTFTFAIKQYEPAAAATQITPAGANAVSRWAKANQPDLASASASLGAFAPVGTEVATLAFSDEAVATTYALESEFPKKEMFDVVGNKIVSLKKPSDMGQNGFAAGDVVELDIQAIQGGKVVNTFAVIIEVDYCAGNTQCSAQGTDKCMECHSGPGGEEKCDAAQLKQQFICVCAAAFTGGKCDVAKSSVEFKQATGGDEGGEDSNGGMIAGIVVGVVLLLVIIAVLVVVAVMRTSAKSMEDQKQSVYAHVAKRDAKAKRMFEAGDGPLPARPDENYEAMGNPAMDMSVTNPNYNAGATGYGAQPIGNPTYQADLESSI